VLRCGLGLWLGGGEGGFGWGRRVPDGEIKSFKGRVFRLGLEEVGRWKMEHGSVITLLY
jgi:hypothetical protein